MAKGKVLKGGTVSGPDQPLAVSPVAVSTASPAPSSVVVSGYAVTPQDLAAGRNRVRVLSRAAGKNEGRVEQLVSVGTDPIGGVRVVLDNGVTCAYDNKPETMVLIGRAMTPITPWNVIQNPDEQWLSLYVGRGGLAARVYATGTWNVYSSRGDWQEGRASSIAEGKQKAIAALRVYGADVSVLEE